MKTGILLDENYDLFVRDGTIQLGDCTRQDQQLLLLTHPGEWKDSPTTGIGLSNWFNDNNPGSLQLTIKRQLKAHGFKVDRVDITDGEIKIDAYYEDS